MPYPRATIKEKFHPTSLRLMDQVREVLRYHHYAIRTEEALFVGFYSLSVSTIRNIRKE